ncbi:hypothetical protein TWF730_005833 [Orbilia blumenaviensis]|uniref:C2H2-type domain-containing protein n=1 Tax=Orbilia blumenaviensis TaxID=1796055 RepID=A0AAV9VLR8_9PEZI
MTPHLSSSTTTTTNQITCTLPTCPHRTHATTESFETHYAKYHTNRCHDCLKNFPTLRILECHIRENHDMFAVVKREKGEKIYACFVEDCDKVCRSFGKRRAHLVDKHYYHKNFNFSIVDTGIDRATTLLTTSPPRKSRTRVRRASEASTNGINTAATNTTTANAENKVKAGKVSNGGGEKMEEEEEEDGGNRMDIDDGGEEGNTTTTTTTTLGRATKKHTRSTSEPSIATVKEARAEEEKGEEEDKEKKKRNKEKEMAAKADEDTDMTDIISKMGAIRFVPPSVVRFGRRGGGGGFSKK